jgi:hypothetical protein
MRFVIICSDQQEFIEICCELVREGISFEADTDAGWVINCTGAF